MGETLSPDQFLFEVCRYLDLELEGLDMELSLEEQGIDSLGKLELLFMLEDFAGHEMPEELWLQEITLRDVYTSYETYASRDRMETT